ncbi:MAG: hypothetical protein ACE5ES_02650 [Candidatus Nanoarchaeia archaeon]
MGKIKNTFDWFKTKPATTGFAIAALISGFLFLNKSMTGNVVLNDKYSINLISIVGLLLISCAVVLGMYTIKKKK